MDFTTYLTAAIGSTLATLAAIILMTTFFFIQSRLDRIHRRRAIHHMLQQEADLRSSLERP